MMQELPSRALLVMILANASFSCSATIMKRSQAILQNKSAEATSQDDPTQNISTTESSLATEPTETTSEAITPPANISGSYLICAEAKAATAESPEAVVNCGLRDQVTSSKIDLSGFASKTWTYQVEAASSITASISDLASSLEWNVAITLKAASLGDLQTAQKNIKFFLTVEDAAGNKFREMSSLSINCSGLTGGTWVLVPGDRLYGTEDFCVMKFEAKDVSGVATSEAPGLPWVNISQTAAQKACQSLGASVHLITNNEWLSLASNIASLGSNWSGGTLGAGAMNRGHTDNSPNIACAASAVDAFAYVQTDCTPLNTGIALQKRTHTLSTGAVIWDLVGNISEWTSYVIANNNAKPYVSADQTPGSVWRELSAVDAGFTAMTLHDLRPINTEKTFWNDSWNSNQGVGQYLAGPNGSGGALRRGNDFAGGILAGLFSANMSFNSTQTASNLGFRCTRSAVTLK